MELLTPSRHLEKSPFKDVTNSTPTPGLRVVGNSPHKAISTKQRSKRSMITPQRRSTRLSSLKSEPDEVPQTVITRSRRKVTPGPGSATARKRSSRRDMGDGSTGSGHRTRRSISTLPSSPLAAKNSPVKAFSSPSEPRSTRSNRSSSSETKTSTIPVINESELEGNTSPLKIYNDQNNESLSRFGDNSTPFEQYPLPASPQKGIMTPFKRYPLPASPLKSINLNVPSATPVQRLTPRPMSAVKSLIAENDVFAISPGMFPRKTKRIDYLDILADTERKAFVSPVKSLPKISAAQSPLDSESPRIEYDHTAIIDGSAEERDVDAEDEKINVDVRMAETEPTEEDHPHFALLSYLADVASVSQHLPEEAAEEELAHGGIEHILTAAALAESMKEEIFVEEVMPSINAEDDDHSDVEVDITTVDEETGVEEAITEEMEAIVLPLEQDEQEQFAPDKVSTTQEDTEQDTPEIPNDVTKPKDIPGSSEVCHSLTGIEPEAAENQGQMPDDQMTVADDDWESLISFSEADDTLAVDRVDAEADNVRIPLDQSVQEAEQSMGAIESELNSPTSKEQPTPSATVGINEIGEFVTADIKFFEDVVETDEVPIQNANARESLSNNITFSTPAEQALITSPPKRHLSSSQEDYMGIKKQKTGPVLPNTTRLDILRKRATRVRSREARHNIKRRDFITALKPVLDNLPSPNTKMAHLKHTPALIPPSLAIKRLQSPVTPAPTKRQRAPEDETPLSKAMSPVKQLSVRKGAVSPRKNIIIHPSPVKETPKPEFRFVFDTKTNDENAPPSESLPKPTPRYEVYSKIFGPPPQLSKHLVEKDPTATLKLGDLQNTTTLFTAESNKLKSPVRKRRLQENDTKSLAKKKMAVELGTPTVPILGRPVRNESFAVPSIPVPPGPPQLPPSIQRNNNSKRFTALGQSVLPSPAQPPPSVIRSSLPRPAGVFGSALPVPATRRSTRVPKVAKEVGVVGGKSVVANGAITTALPPQQAVPVPEKKALLNGHDNVPAVSEKIVAPPAPVLEHIVPTENVTMERPKGKLGGAQRVTRGAAENKKVEVSTRPTRPPTPPLTSLSMKELKSLTDVNTKKNEGFKTVNLKPTVKRVNRKRPGEPSDEFAVGKGAKWSKTEALPEWDRDLSEDGRAVRWKSPRFATRTEKTGAMRVKPILKKKERERIEKEEEVLVAQSEPLVVQRFVYKGEK